MSVRPYVRGKEERAVMAAPIPREWVGLQQFPAATQTKLHELLGKLKEEVLHVSLTPLTWTSYLN